MLTEREPRSAATPGADPPPASPTLDRVAGMSSAVSLAVVLAALLLVPLGLRGVYAVSPASDAPPSYLPALEPTRVRELPFETAVPANLQAMQPEFVLIGDSMVGSRVDATLLTVLLGDRPVAPLSYAGTGSAFWYLALKNWVVASQTRPKRVIVFFRDENLTDPLFRVNDQYRPNLDRVAREREPALNDIMAMHTAGPWYRIHAALDDAYRHDAVRAWIEPKLVALPVDLVVRPGARAGFLARINADIFGLTALRQMSHADMAQAADADTFDFGRNVSRSVLPEIFKVAARGGLKLAFVRVQRRPSATGPPPQSPALARYVADLEAYIVSHGGLFADDWGDPEQPLSIYADGDHVTADARPRYTERFLKKHPAFFR